MGESIALNVREGTIPLHKNSDFLWFLLGQTLSQIGTAMTTFTIPWLFLQITGSAAQTGIAFAVGFIPYILVSMPAGVWADRLNRKHLMVASDLARLCLLASVPLTHLVFGQTPLFVLYVVQAGVSALSAIFDAAYGSCVPNLVGPEQYEEANNLTQGCMSFSRICGPILAGILIPILGTANSLSVDIMSYIVSIASLIIISKPFAQARHRTRQTFSQDFREGFRTVWRIRPVRYLMIFATLVNLVGPGMDVALLYRIQHELHLPPRWAGIIMTGLSGGMLLGSLTNRWAGKRINARYKLNASVLLLIGPPVALAFTKNPFVICTIQIIIGILLVAWNVQSVTLRQVLIPDHLRGRCTSIFRLCAWVSIPVGDALAGLISQAHGTQTYFMVSAAVLALVATLTVQLRVGKTVSQSFLTEVS